MTLPFLTTAEFRVIVTLGVFAGAIYSFVREKLPPDVTALLALLALLVTGVLTPAEAFAGFSHPATVSVAAVLVLSAGVERTGVLSLLARRLLAPLARREILLTGSIMVVIAALSAFINNTAAVAIFIPVVLDVCRRRSLSPGRVLMPMSYAATFGGLCTLVGTSTNLVAHEYALSQGLRGFSMFELGKVGLPMLVAGFAYILLVGRWFLPRSQPLVPDVLQQDDRYFTELVVLPGAKWIGREIHVEHLERDFNLELLGVVRGDEVLDLTVPVVCYEPGDSLRVRGRVAELLPLARQEGLRLHPAVVPEAIDDSRRPALAEVVVLITSGLIGRTLRAVRFAERYDAVVLGMRRRGRITQRPSDTPLHAGDVLLVQGSPQALQNLADTQGFLAIGTPAHPEERPRKLVVSLLTLVAVVAAVTLRLVPIVTAATAGCAVLIVSGCLRPREAYRAIDLSLVFLLAGSLALGLALEKTGVTTSLARALSDLTAVTGPYVVLGAFFLVAMVLSELMSNSGTVALLAPVAVSSAAQMQVNPMALLAAVAFGASAAFAIPIGYQTSLMIYGPGGYRFRDFLRMGLPLDLILALIALWLIPRYWPLPLP